MVAFQSRETNGQSCPHALCPQGEIVQLQSAIVNNNRGTMKALENQLAGEQERCSQREFEARQRWIKWKASREGYARAEEMTHLLLVWGE